MYLVGEINLYWAYMLTYNIMGNVTPGCNLKVQCNQTINTCFYQYVLPPSGNQRSQVPVMQGVYFVVCKVQDLQPGEATDCVHGTVIKVVGCQKQFLDFVQIFYFIDRWQRCQAIMGHIENPEPAMQILAFLSVHSYTSIK